MSTLHLAVRAFREETAKTSPEGELALQRVLRHLGRRHRIRGLALALLVAGSSAAAVLGIQKQRAGARSSAAGRDLRAAIDAAAGAAFDKLDRETDGDGTLTRQEAAGRFSKAEFAAADDDDDQTVSRVEYIAFAEKIFAASSENGGKAGPAFEKLIK